MGASLASFPLASPAPEVLPTSSFEFLIIYDGSIFRCDCGAEASQLTNFLLKNFPDSLQVIERKSGTVAIKYLFEHKFRFDKSVVDFHKS